MNSIKILLFLFSFNASGQSSRIENEVMLSGILYRNYQSLFTQSDIATLKAQTDEQLKDIATIILGSTKWNGRIDESFLILPSRETLIFFQAFSQQFNKDVIFEDTSVFLQEKHAASRENEGVLVHNYYTAIFELIGNHQGRLDLTNISLDNLKLGNKVCQSAFMHALIQYHLSNVRGFAILQKWDQAAEMFQAIPLINSQDYYSGKSYNLIQSKNNRKTNYAFTVAYYCLMNIHRQSLASNNRLIPKELETSLFKLSKHLKRMKLIPLNCF